MLNNALCALCQVNVESCQHLFLECKHAMSVWFMCFRWVGILFVQHNDVKTHFENFHLFQISNKQNMVWKGIWTTVVRCIWDQRNTVVFKQGVVDMEEIFQKVQLKSWLWVKHHSSFFSYSLVDWILNPIPCIKSIK